MTKCRYSKCQNVQTGYSYIAGDGSRVTDFCSEVCMLHHIKHFEEDYK